MHSAKCCTNGNIPLVLSLRIEFIAAAVTIDASSEDRVAVGVGICGRKLGARKTAIEQLALVSRCCAGHKLPHTACLGVAHGVVIIHRHTETCAVIGCRWILLKAKHWICHIRDRRLLVAIVERATARDIVDAASSVRDAEGPCSGRTVEINPGKCQVVIGITGSATKAESLIRCQ